MQQKYGKGGQLKRFHFTCLTCPIRRYHYQAEASGFVKVESIMLFGESADRRGADATGPTDTAYFIMVKLGSSLDSAKRFLSRELLHLAAHISLWQKPRDRKHKLGLLLLKEGTIMPISYTTYFASFPLMGFLRHQIVKLFVTVAERIAEC